MDDILVRFGQVVVADDHFASELRGGAYTLTTSHPPRPVEFWMLMLRATDVPARRAELGAGRRGRRHSVERDVMGAPLDLILGGVARRWMRTPPAPPAIVKPSTVTPGLPSMVTRRTTWRR